MIDFHLTPLGVTTVSLCPIGNDAPKAREALDSFCLSFGGAFPLAKAGERSLEIFASTLSRTKEIPAIMGTIQLVASGGMSILSTSSASERLNVYLNREEYAAALRQPGEGAGGSWYVDSSSSKGLREGVTFFNSDGRILSLIQAGSGSGEHFIVGFGLVGAAMCYVEVSDSGLAGKVQAFFAMESVSAGEVNTSFAHAHADNLRRYYQSVGASSEVGILDSEGNSLSNISPESPFNIVTTMSVGSSGCYSLWQEDAGAGEIPIGRLSYHPSQDVKAGLMLAALYRPRGASIGPESMYPNIMNSLQEAFSPR